MMENDSKTVIKGGQSTSGTDVTIRTDANTLDLRGKNINTAKELSMNFFAKKLSSKTVFILHGHGGKLHIILLFSYFQHLFHLFARFQRVAFLRISFEAG